MITVERATVEDVDSIKPVLSETWLATYAAHLSSSTIEQVTTHWATRSLENRVAPASRPAGALTDPDVPCGAIPAFGVDPRSSDRVSRFPRRLRLELSDLRVRGIPVPLRPREDGNLWNDAVRVLERACRKRQDTGHPSIAAVQRTAALGAESASHDALSSLELELRDDAGDARSLARIHRASRMSGATQSLTVLTITMSDDQRLALKLVLHGSTQASP
jgi:hypothetical protein